MPVRKPVKQILIQPDLPPNLAVKTKMVVPELLSWHLPTPPKPKPLPAPQRQVPAKLIQPVTPVIPAPPLSVPVATSTRLLDGVAAAKLSSPAPVIAVPEQLNVISIPEVPVPQAQVVVLPPGNQGAESTAVRDGTDAGQGTNGTAALSRAGSQAGAGASAGAGAKAGSKSGSGSGGADDARGSGAPAGVAGIGKGVGDSGGEMGGGKNGNSIGLGGGTSGTSGGAEAGTAGVSTGSPLPAGTTRIDKPRDGKYNVVVMGLSSSYPEAAGILSGKPVYTVYVHAGGRKEWILQYCLPKNAEPAARVRGSAMPVEAPYPFLMYHPILTLANDPDYVMVHGFISAAGKFEHLTAVGEIDPASGAKLVAALDQWQFRPASRDGEPSAVEILLIIPRDAT